MQNRPFKSTVKLSLNPDQFCDLKNLNLDFCVIPLKAKARS